MKIVIATENQGKLKEIQSFFSHLPINFMPQSAFNVPAIEERGLSFIENAILKARHASKLCELPALADDSGLAVEALGGAPGIHSARYAGPKARDEDNIKKLLNAITSLSGDDRRAHFHCVIAYVRHYNDPIPIICQAQWDGLLLTKPQGKGGFGYDPIFYIPDLHCTAAELEAHVKNKISHRAKALTQFVEQFKVAYPELKLKTSTGEM